MKKYQKILSVLFVNLLYSSGFAQGTFSNDTARTNIFEIESGVFTTQKMEFRGYNQGNATENWKSIAPTLRLEYWNKKNTGWNYGMSIQPIYFKYSDTIRNNLNYDGQVFNKGERASLIYQFHNITTTANYPIIKKSEHNFLRLGGTIIFRYADFNFKAETNSFRSTNFIIFPLINTELKIKLKNNLFFFSRADFLPSPTKRVFSDGLFNVLFSVKHQFKTKQSLDIGTRLFFGGDDEMKQDDYANRIFFLGAVIKYSF
jgi:hypothetical protein